MTGPEHFREAERLVQLVDDGKAGSGWHETIAQAQAQVHATLALAAATALPHAGEMPVADHDAWFAAAGSRAAAALSAGKPPAAQPLAAVVDVAGLAVEEAAALGLQLINLNLDVHLPSLTVQSYPTATPEQGAALLDALSATCEPDVSRADGLTWYYLSALVPNDVLVRVVCRDEPVPVGGAQDTAEAGESR